MKPILLIEDDPVLNANIRDAFLQEGYTVETVFDGQLAERMLQRRDYALVVMDVNLPGKNGFDLCQAYRSHNQKVPVLILTAFDELEDKVKGYGSGADDYMTKPFYMRELMLKSQVLLKRATISMEDFGLEKRLVFDDIVLDKQSKKVTRDGTEINFTPREYQILYRLLAAKGDLVSKKDLITEIWGTVMETNTNTIEVYINFLRNKLDKPFGKETIRTRVGYGYYLDADKRCGNKKGAEQVSS
ncbi:putative two-component response regulator transcriptional regulatory protein [Lunatimonas lonarensis]|uniref:Putative two-component response regulator transcriptional regulatory protein n=1 Tax=Lunatimonas lonarensis TaxID=1232681 RepID=R7ZRK5_9BACT|nr:response regulator transcription factor [Lunatimonas lonarensis]EON76609.1 putative two-component response regulator transcriptional regulatory protein [Lunatimonas lonarensis]